MTFVTLRKDEPGFSSYLDGSFSKSERAIPTNNLNVNTTKEEVTFKLVPVEDIELPRWPTLLFRLFRFEWLSLTMGPAIATVSYLGSHQSNFVWSEDWLNVMVAFLGVFLLHCSVFALNDYKDYVTGFDRINQSGGSQVIRKGWMTAKNVRRFGFVCFALGSLLGALLVFQQPFYLIVVGAFTLIAVGAFSFWGGGLKTQGFAEIFAFFSFGPMMTYGMSRVASHFHSPEVIILGIGFGFLAALVLQARQLENLLSDAQKGLRTTAVKLGFDRSKKLIQIQVSVLPLLFLVTSFICHLPFLAWAMVIPLTYFCVRIYLNLSQASSSLSSATADIKLQLSDLHIIYSTFIAFGFWFVF